ncbi:MAG TPA: hypothetical protein VFV84_09810 [Burkholderiales bacterium]|nr:hypothetical protein [Burkholderiales bacterium]
MKRVLLPVLAAALLAAGAPARAADFEFEMDAPKLHVTLPGVPPMKMAPHPLHEKQAHLRYLGTQGPYTVSIITPAAQAGMTALECASATVRAMARRHGFPPDTEVFKTRLDEHTYAAMYALSINGAVQLNAHILSAAGGKYCVEVQASKMSDSPDELVPWFKSLEGARIAPQ